MHMKRLLPCFVSLILLALLIAVYRVAAIMLLEYFAVVKKIETLN